MVNVDAFLKEIERIAESNPSYRTGGKGKDGTCDCIGLIMGALEACGVKPMPLHSSNYAARYEMKELNIISNEWDCTPGMIVYKAREGSGLNSKYLEGGVYYNGDELDYYHVGVVTSVEPFEITHCTSSENGNGIVKDSSLGEWEYGGLLLCVDYTACYEEGEAMKAIVVAQDNGKVRLRSKPSTSASTIIKIGSGTEVNVLDSGSGWSTIEYSGKRGYIMTEYLSFVEEEQKDEEEKMLISVAVEIKRLLEIIVEKLSGNGGDVNG